MSRQYSGVGVGVGVAGIVIVVFKQEVVVRLGWIAKTPAALDRERFDDVFVV